MDKKDNRMIKIPSWVVLVIMIYTFFNYVLRKNTLVTKSFSPASFSTGLDSIKGNSVIYPDSAVIGESEFDKLLGRD